MYGEKLAPIVTLITVKNFENALCKSSEILDNYGAGHSISIHTEDRQKPIKIAKKIKICRVIVNQGHSFATGGDVNNSLSMGCSSRQQNYSDDNINWRNYCNVIKISTHK